jgi:hypothetical protein
MFYSFIIAFLRKVVKRGVLLRKGYIRGENLLFKGRFIGLISFISVCKPEVEVRYV